jgi:indolepyruvate ferredoxin oxidoreductase beta subunit
VNKEQITPTELTAKRMDYPKIEEITAKIRRFTKKIIVLNAPKLAREAGNILTENIVLIGASLATEGMPLKEENIIEALKELLPAKHLEANVKAFKLGYEYVKKKTED